MWHVLTPDCVHPAFRQAVLAVVREQAADKADACAEIVEFWLPNWELKCSPSENVRHGRSISSNPEAGGVGAHDAVGGRNS